MNEQRKRERWLVAFLAAALIAVGGFTIFFGERCADRCAPTTEQPTP